MKKITTLVLAAIMLIVCLAPISSIIPQANSTENVPTSSAEHLIEISDGATLEDATIQDGKVTFKVTLPQNGYAQFMQKVTIDADVSSTLQASVIAADNDVTHYNNMNMYMQLTASSDITKDIVPIKESDTNLPSNDGMTWHFYGQESKSIMWYGLGDNTSKTYDGSTSAVVTNGVGTKLVFTKTDSGTVLPKAPHVNGGTIAELPSYKTLTDIGGNNGVYFRLRSYVAQTYTVTLESPDIKSDVEYYDATDFVKYSDGALLYKDSVSVVDGSATFKIKLPANGFAQFNQKLTDLIGGGATVNIQIGTNSDDDYTSANMQVQLTANPDATTDIVPVNEYAKEDPGLEGMTWLFYGNSARLWTGRGKNTNGGGTYSIPATAVPALGGINIKFNLDDAGTVSYESTDTPDGFNNNLSSTKTLEQIGGTNGVYFRLRSVIAQTYTVTIKSKDIKNVIKESNDRYDNNFVSAIEQNMILSTGSSLDIKNSYLGDGMVSFKVTLPADGYAQFDQKLTDLIGGGATVNIKIGDNTNDDYLGANMQVQLVADPYATTDISPVNENSYDPGVVGMTWLFFGSSPRLWTGKGDSTASGGTYSNPATDVPGLGGINIKFNLDDAGTVSYESTDSPSGFNNILSSKKTLKQIGGTDGVYFRLRSKIAQTYTVTIKSNDIKNTYDYDYDYSDLFKFGAKSGETSTATVDMDSVVIENGRITFKANVPDHTYVQFMQKLPITDDMASTLKVSVKAGSHDATTYGTKSKFFMQLTSSTDLTNDFSRADESGGLTWHLYAGSNSYGSNILIYDKGATTRYIYDTPANIITANVGPTLCFTKTVDSTILPVAPYVESGVIELPSSNTLTDLGGDDGLYFRFRGDSDGCPDFTITIESPYIKPCEENLYRDDVEFVKYSNGAILHEDTVSVEDGNVTFKVTLPADGYAQFDQKLTDLVGGDATVNIKVGTNSNDDYTNANMQVQLTADPYASTDIVPVNENGGVDPGVVGMTWLFYGNSQRLWTGRGINTNGGGTYSIPATAVPGLGGINIKFNLDDAGTVSYESTDTTNGFNNNLSSNKTLEQIGGTDGVYFRLRSEIAQTYTVTIKSKDIKTPIIEKDRYSFSDDESYLISSSHNVENGVVTDKFTFKLNGLGSNIQLDEKIATLIDGGFAKVYLGDNKSADYAATNFSMQLTSKPDELHSDPVDEAEYQTDPRTISFSFGMAGVRMAVNKGANPTGGGSSTYIPNYANTPGVDGINLYFKTNKTTGTLDVSRVSPLNDYNFTKTSSHTIADADLTDGAYFRLRHAGSTPQVYTVVLTYSESKDVEHNLSNKAYTVIDEKVVNADNTAETYAKGKTITKAGHYVVTSTVNKGTVTKDIYLYKTGDINGDNSTNVLDAFIAAKNNRYAELSDVGALGMKAIDKYSSKNAYTNLRKELLGLDYEVPEYTDYKPVTLNIEDFGAVGDGVTDDGVAIYDALQALRQSAPGSVLEFEAKTYRFVDNGKYGQLTGGKKLNQSVFEFYGDKGLTIRGKTDDNGNTTLISLGGTSDYYKNYYANIENSEDIAFENINFDYAEYKAAFAVTSLDYKDGWLSAYLNDTRNILKGYLVKDANGKYPDIHLEDGEVYTANGNAQFGVLNKENNRVHMYFTSFKMVNKATGEIEITLNKEHDNTMNNLGESFFSGISDFILPMPYSGNLIERGFSVHGVNNFTMKDCKVFSASRHGMSLQNNSGDITFDNVDVIPSDDKLNFTSWGDFYHVLNSTGANYTWKDCEARYNYDDVFNISAATLKLNKINSLREIEIGEGENGFGKVYAGTTLVIVDTATGELVYRDTIKRVIEQDDASANIRLSSSLPDGTTLDNKLVWIDEAVGTSTMQNCTFDGTFRARGNIAFNSCNFTVKRFWIGLESATREGPLSRNIVFNNCSLTCQSDNVFEIGSYNEGTNATASNAYKLENIKFSGCTWKNGSGTATSYSSFIKMFGNSADEVIHK